MGSRRAIYNDIAPKQRFFFVRGNKILKGRAEPAGPKARGHCPARGNFSAEDFKKSEVEATISLYIAWRDPMYILSIPFFLSLFSKEFINALLISLWIIQQIRKFYQIRELYVNLGISNQHCNIDEKEGPLYIALRTGHIYMLQGIYVYIIWHICIYALCTGYIYMPCAQGIYLYRYMPCTLSNIRQYSPQRGAISVFTRAI